MSLRAGRCVRIAYFSPLPPERSGISDYSAELLPHLANFAHVTLFVARPEAVAANVRAAFETRDIAEYSARPGQHDLALYQMGNSLYHDAIYRTLLRYPGITVLHDLGLHHFMAGRTLYRDDFCGYARELGYALGTAGVELAHRIRRGQAEPPFYEIPLYERVLDHSLGVIVHSHYVAQRLRDSRPNLPVEVAPAPVRGAPGPTRSRAALGCPEKALLFASAGQLIANRQITLALEAFARLRADFPEAHYVIVGDDLGQKPDLQAWIAQQGLTDVVRATGYLEDLQDYLSWIAAADVLVNLRSPTVGETSATVLRALVAGRPVIVSDHGWYAELPDDVCIKVAPDDGDAVYRAMRRLADDAALRRELGWKAAEYAPSAHSLTGAAHKYREFIGDICAGAGAARGSNYGRRSG